MTWPNPQSLAVVLRHGLVITEIYVNSTTYYVHSAKFRSFGICEGTFNSMCKAPKYELEHWKKVKMCLVILSGIY